MFREETNASMKVHGSDAPDVFIMLRLALGINYPLLKANPPLGERKCDWQLVVLFGWLG